MSSLRVSIIQSNLVWESPDANLQHFGKILSDLKSKTDVAVLPEMFSTGFSMKPAEFAETMEGKTFHWMKQAAAQNRLILTGSFMVEENGKYFNRLIWMLPDGNFGFYDKRHLFGFAGEHEHYTAGNRRLIASANGFRINLQVCYDLRFPVWSRQKFTGNGAPEYDVLIYVANWPERRNTAWKTLLQARAIENQCFVIGVNRVGEDGNGIYHSGDSMLIDPLGEIMYHAEHVEDVFTTTLQKHTLEEIREKFPFLRDRDDFYIS